MPMIPITIISQPQTISNHRTHALDARAGAGISTNSSLSALLGCMGWSILNRECKREYDKVRRSMIPAKLPYGAEIGEDGVWRQVLTRMSGSRPRPALFLDRDGVLVEE
ncbi:MAG: hypothetical protein NWR87_07290, partial [Rhodospirillales bacterium]|nr:hypothetical protein [Rhodospirillales bacterium]